MARALLALVSERLGVPSRGWKVRRELRVAALLQTALAVDHQ